VLDGATVRTACYSLRTPHRHATSVFLRVLRADDREAGLRQAVRQVNAAERSNAVYATSQAGFTSLPWAVFGYWCSEAVRGAFSTMPTMEPAGAVVRQGLATSDDGRFLRLRWEVRNASVGRGRAWLPFAKGGVFSPFHDDVHLALRWQADGYELKQLSVQRYGSATKRVCSEDWYFRPGLTYPLRTNKRFAPRALPSGCAFGHKGPAVVDVTGSRTALLALLSSRPASYLLGLALGTAEAEGGAGANSYEVGLVQRLPCPPEATTDEDLTTFGDRSWQLRAEPDVRAETTARFVSPLAPVSPQGCLAATLHALLALRRDHEAEYERLQHAIDDRVRVLYRLTDSDWDEIQREVGPVHSVPVPDDDDPKALEAFATAYVQFAVGCAFGRWDPAQAHVTDTSSALADPFEPVRAHADADPSADAVLVDDSGHPADLARRVQAVFETHWGDAAPDVAQEAAAALSARGGELRAWLRRGFFAEHIKRYSKSRRKAPVYWQLATPSAGYSAWLYYPRAGGDTLFRVLTELVGPKLAHEERHLDALRGDLAAGPTVRLRKQVAGQETLVEELAAFRAELARVAPLWDPHPDDGVIVNFAPLWRLVPQHRSWQQACRKTWDALVRGDYDWSHLAMRLWPERVVPKCAGDRSLAIAHGLEGVFWTEDAAGKWQPRAVAESEVERLVRERSSASVQAAVEELLTTSTAEPAPRRGKER